MRVQELRKCLSEADRGLLEKAFVESYKMIPKSRKEELAERYEERKRHENID